MKRRAFVACGAAAVMCRGARAAARPAALAFRVMREGSAIGTHRIDFSDAGSGTLAHIRVAMRVGIGPLTLFRYSHEAWELWDAAGFASLASVTTRNGTVGRVTARREADAVIANGARLDGRAIPFTHWNIAVTDRPLFDPEHGVAAPEQVRARGVAPAPLAGGGTVSGRRFDFSGRATISDWYGEDDTWVALSALAPDGSTITYERV